MKKEHKVLGFLMDNEINEENINSFINVNKSSVDDMLQESFKSLNKLIFYLSQGVEKDDLDLIRKSILLISTLCDMKVFNADDILLYKKKIKKTRESLLLKAKQQDCEELLYLANKVDEIVLDKSFEKEDLITLIKELINKKEDPNIIKKFLNINKEAVINNLVLFDYTFIKTLDSLNNNNIDIYYYITLLKIFYTSRVKKHKYMCLLNDYENNPFVDEIKNLLNGIKRSLNTDEILKKYNIISELPESKIVLPNNCSKSNESIFTIDDTYTNLRDDGLSIKKDGSNYIVKINIADVASYVRPGSIEDKNAKTNFRNFHFGSGVTMLPLELRKNLSLNLNSTQKVVTMILVVNDSGEIIDRDVVLRDVYISHNISYDSCDKLIGKTSSKLERDLTDLYYLACALSEKSNSKNLYWSKKEQSRSEFTVSSSKGFKVIREFMVIYNMFMGQICNQNNIPYVYRYQDPEYITNLIKKKGFSLNDQIRNVINSTYLDSKFSIVPRYHVGIKTDIYTQSTDPLRKYPDLYNQQLFHKFYFGDIDFDFDYDEFIANVDYFNERNRDLQLMRAEYNRGMRLNSSK